MKYIILHSPYDGQSRNFISKLPNKKGDEYEIIDWYGDEYARFQYTGPPASAFPSVMWELEDGRAYIARLPANWQEVDFIVAASNANEYHPKMSYCERDIEYLGGQRIPEIESLLLECPYHFSNVKVILEKITICKSILDETIGESGKGLSHEERVEQIKTSRDEDKANIKVGLKVKATYAYHNTLDKFNSETPSKLI